MYKTFASFSFGCRVNQAEKEELDSQLISLGFSFSKKSPDFYIINTCAVTAKAEREARQFIYQTRRKFPKTKIIVTGCSATKWINEKTKIKEVDLLIDNINKEYIAKIISIRQLADDGQMLKPHFKTQNLSKEINTLNLKVGGAKEGFPNGASLGSAGDTRWAERVALEAQFGTPERQDPRITISKKNKYISSGRLLLKIQDGCQRFCTYCIVPYLRGKPQSRSIKYLVSSIKYCEKSIKEVILAAINTEAYGLDTGESLIKLISSIIEQTSIPRLSLGSIHPWSVDSEFFKFYKRILSQKRLVNFFHIPLQSGSNKILSLMKRGYSREEFREKLHILHKLNPFAFIGTDIMVGFLEEEDSDFADTYKFLATSPIARFHVFRFSKREGTAAFYMAKKLKEPTPSEKLKRAKLLGELSKKKYVSFLAKHIGSTSSALFLDKKIDGFGEALLDNQVPILVKTDKNWVGEIKIVQINNLRDDKLIGKLL